MSEMSQAFRMLKGGLPTVVIKYPSGRYGLAGRIPVELTEPVTGGTPQVPPLRGSKVWATEQDVVDALLALGITDFQRSTK